MKKIDVNSVMSVAALTLLFLELAFFVYAFVTDTARFFPSP